MPKQYNMHLKNYTIKLSREFNDANIKEWTFRENKFETNRNKTTETA